MIDRGEHSVRVASVAARRSAEMRDATRFMQRGGARDKGHGAPMKRPAGWLQRLRPFGIGARWSGRPLARPDFGRGCSSGVEHDLAKVGVEGSNPFARSKILLSPAEITKNYSIPRSESGSQRRFVLVDFTHMNTARRLRVYEADDMSAVRHAVAHAAAKRGFVGRENRWALSAMIHW